MNDLNQFKNNGFLVKKNLITQKEINKINKVVNEVISKEKKEKDQITKTVLNLMTIIILFTILVHQKIRKF
jgi:Na+/glutamate symporter